MYDDILNGPINNNNDECIDINELLDDENDIKEIKNLKYKSKDVIGIVISDENIEGDELIRIKNKILDNIDYDEDEIVFVIRNIIIEI